MDRVTGLISANYETKALGSLTSERTIASLPYGGRYRMIDFPLSNMVNSGIHTVGLITPYKYRSILDHIGAGKAWSLDRKNGGLFILPGSAFGLSSSHSRFLLQDLRRNEVYLKRSQAEFVLIAATDTVYNMDYRPMVQRHIETGAEITMLYHEAALDAPNDLGLTLRGDQVTGFFRGETLFRSCFVLRRSLLLNILSWYEAVDYLDIFEALEGDLGKMDVRGYRFDGYIGNIATVRDYFQHSMELLRGEVWDELFSRENPIMTKVQDSVPTKYLNGAVVKNALIPAGCVIQGTVENSILFRGVKVAQGAVVRNSILMQSCVVEPGAVVENAILDRGNTIAAGTFLKGAPENVFIMNKKIV